MDGSAARRKLTVEEFTDWAEARPDGIRYELLEGEIIVQSVVLPRHARLIKAVDRALEAGLPETCEVLPGVGVRVADDTALIPDLAVYCSRRIGNEERWSPDPAIVVEVLSPSTMRYDMGGKAAAYFTLDSLQHYLILHPEERFVLRHSRRPKDNWGVATIAREDLVLDPPGVRLDVAAIFAAVDQSVPG